MRKQQATKANENQIKQHIRRQRAGISGLEFAHAYPITDAVLGGVLLACVIGGLLFLWIKAGAGV